MKPRWMAILMAGILLLTGCRTAPASSQPAIPSPDFSHTETFPGNPAIPTSIFTPSTTSMPAAAPNFCSDPKATALIDSLKRAMLNADGPLFSSLVSPNGMEVRYFRDGTVITYTPEQANFLFETTFEANWGAEPGSGLDKTGAFHDVIVPALAEIFNKPYTLHCSELRHGGATYEVTWPYDRDFYAIHFPGTDQYGYMDWHTWAAGIEYVNGKPYLYALMQFFWEP